MQQFFHAKEICNPVPARRNCIMCVNRPARTRNTSHIDCFALDRTHHVILWPQRSCFHTHAYHNNVFVSAQWTAVQIKNMILWKSNGNGLPVRLNVPLIPYQCTIISNNWCDVIVFICFSDHFASTVSCIYSIFCFWSAYCLPFRFVADLASEIHTYTHMHNLNFFFFKRYCDFEVSSYSTNAPDSTHIVLTKSIECGLIFEPGKIQASEYSIEMTMHQTLDGSRSLIAPSAENREVLQEFRHSLRRMPNLFLIFH